MLIIYPSPIYLLTYLPSYQRNYLDYTILYYFLLPTYLM